MVTQLTWDSRSGTSVSKTQLKFNNHQLSRDSELEAVGGRVDKATSFSNNVQPPLAQASDGLANREPDCGPRTWSN